MEGGPEGSGQVLLAKSGNIDVYVTNYPLFLVVNYSEDGIVWFAKTNTITGTIDLILNRNENVARLKTRIGGHKVQARCTKKLI